MEIYRLVCEVVDAIDFYESEVSRSEVVDIPLSDNATDNLPAIEGVVESTAATSAFMI